MPAGLGLVALAALAFSAMAVLVKLALVTLPLGEVVFARGVVTLLVSYAMCRAAGLRPMQRASVRLLSRGLLGFAGLTCYYGSLALLPLAEATTIHHVTPLLTAVLGVWLIREPVARTTGLAIVVGLAGILVVASPELGGAVGSAPLGVAVAAGGACCSALAYLTVRVLSRTEDPLVIVFFFPLVATPLALPWLLAEPVLPSAREALLLVGVGLATQLGQVCLTRALALLPAARATALGYVQVPMAIAWGLVLFDEALPLTTVLGVLVLGGGLALAAVGRPAATARSA